MTTTLRTLQSSLPLPAVAHHLWTTGPRAQPATTLLLFLAKTRKRGAYWVRGIIPPKKKVFCCDIRAQTQDMRDVPGALERSPPPFLGCEKLPRRLQHQPAVVSLLYYTRPDTWSCWYLSFHAFPRFVNMAYVCAFVPVSFLFFFLLTLIFRILGLAVRARGLERGFLGFVLNGPRICMTQAVKWARFPEAFHFAFSTATAVWKMSGGGGLEGGLRQK